MTYMTITMTNVILCFVFFTYVQNLKKEKETQNKTKSIIHNSDNT